MRGLKTKIDHFLWAFMWMLPVLAFFVSWYRIGAAPSMLSFIDEQFSFSFVKDVINNIWNKAFGADLVLAGSISYLVCVEVVHCLFDALVFIPRIAHSFIDRAVGLAGGERK